MNTAIIIQARMTSTRLPGKILKTVLGKPLLEYQIERLRRVQYADSIIIATTLNETDQPIIDFCNAMDIPFFRGSEEDVLSRYFYAAEKYKADTVVRITSDCPLIDPGVIDKVVQCFTGNYPQFDYVSNTQTRSYPRGMDTEVFSARILKEIFYEAKDQSDREHVTGFIYRNTNKYRSANVSHLENYSAYRLTVDTAEDFELIRRIIECLYPVNPLFALEDIIKLLKDNPDLPLINSHIEQKHY